MQVEVVLGELARDAIQQPRAVARNDIQRMVAAALVGTDVDGGGNREMAHAPRHAAAAGRGQGRLGLQLRAELALDQRHHVAVVRARPLAHHQEAVERIAVARGVDLRLDDVEAGAFEVAADAREQRFAVGGVDHHLQAFAEGSQARAHHGRLRIDPVMQVARLPGDLLRVVAQEVGGIQVRPESLLDRVGERIEAQQARRLGLLFRNRGVQRRRLAGQDAPGQAEQVLQQLCLPAVPDPRAGAADVGDGQQVERDQAALAADFFGEGARDLGIVHVLLLRHRGHGQVVLDQEGHEVGVLLGKAVAPAEAPRVDGAEGGMVAAAPLGDVVEQRGDVEQPAALEAAHELAAERKFVREVRHREAPQVSQHHEDVLVHRVDVVEVVLHLPDDAPEFGQVGAQHVVLVHASELVHDAARLLQDVQEQQPRHRVAPEARVEPAARAPQRAQRGSAHAAQVAVLLHEQEALEDGARLALEQILAARLEQRATRLEALVQRARCRLRAGREARLQVLQQDRVELRNRLGMPVVALHEQFARAPRSRSRVAALLRERILVIEGDAVFAPAGQVVQADAQVLQRGFMARKPLRFALLQQLLLRQVAPVPADAAGLRDPADHLQVAQSARRLLEVGLERVGRVPVLGVPLLLLQFLRLQEGGRLDDARDRFRQAPEEGGVAREQARFEQRRLDGDVALRGLDAGFDAAHAVADFQPDVPEHADQAFDALALALVGFGAEQHQHVHVRAGEQLAAPVAAGGDQRHAGRGAMRAPQSLQRPVDQPGMLVQQPGGPAPLQVGLAQGRARLLQLLAQRFDRIRSGHAPDQPPRPGGGGGVPAETVSTS